MLTTGLAVAVSFACLDLAVLLTAVAWTAVCARRPSAPSWKPSRSKRWPSISLRFHRLALQPTPEWLGASLSLETYLHVVTLSAFVALQAVLVAVPLPGFLSWEASRPGYLALANLAFVLLFGGRLIPFGRLLGIGIGEANRLHRWLGWCFIGLIATHSLGYVLTWAANGSLDINLPRRKVGQGVAALLWLAPLAATSLPFVRHRFYNLFRAAHLCFLPFLACVVAHSTWAPWFFGVPLAVWALDRCMRLWRAAEPVRDVSIVVMPGGLIKIRFTIWPTACGGDASSTPLPGQYIYMRIPGVSFGEWHPFSLCRDTGDAGDGAAKVAVARADRPLPGREPPKGNSGDFPGSTLNAGRPADPDRGGGGGGGGMRCRVYVRARGPFTCRLLACTCSQPACGNYGESAKPAVRPAFTSLEIDGPYGRPSFDPRRYSTNVVVAGGIGAAPMLGWVQWILEDPCRPARSKVIWVWVAKSAAHFQWLEHELGLLRRMIGESAELLPAADVEIYLHVTRDTPSAGKKSVALLSPKAPYPASSCCCTPSNDGQSDFIDLEPLASSQPDASEMMKPREGRPDLDALFKRVAREFGKGGDIGVLACGPSSMLRSVRMACATHSRADVMFRLHTEVFSL